MVAGDGELGKSGGRGRSTPIPGEPSREQKLVDEISEAASLRDDVAEQRALRAAAEGHAERLAADLADQRTALDEMRRQISDLKGEAASARADADAARAATLAAENISASTTTERDAAALRVNELEGALSGERHTSAELRGRAEAVAGERDRLLIERDKAAEELARLKTAVIENPLRREVAPDSKPD
ncbi:hypothetical protein GKE82_25065 [Conexibacter sp. W3-3-2]|uniref:hypothetical protein n=1 Tax=Conexibacter sp. W3-3-2 TaxID=2675227 RepID=UPI0012B7BD4A|nr:hypothetical protein [Conexibacter sp. W3-3-2]MTD47477.1 hypothetical protein [Conexibacter sp. W3-3-2]